MPRYIFRAEPGLHSLTCSLSPQVAIERLPNEILLKIFRQHLYTSPQDWPTLTHVCQKWRQIVLDSPQGLRLRLYCTHGTPVLRDLDCWPHFPLVVSYGETPTLNPPAPEDEENIMAALKQSDRVGSISLSVTKTLLKHLSAISEPFPNLEELALQSRANVQVTLPNAFRWGPRLRTLYLTGFPFPALLQHLSLSTSLVDLRLHEIPSVGYFPPEAFANALSQLAHLKILSLHFLTLPSRRNFVSLSPDPSRRVALPALTSLRYRGTSTYLDRFVARIDAPRLGEMGVIFFGQPTMDASQLGQFIDRIETLTSFDRADVLAYSRDISVCFSKLGLALFKLEISWKPLDWQLSSLTQICDHFSPFLHRVHDLHISSSQPPSEEADMDRQQWRDLIHAFRGTKDLHVAGVDVQNVLWALFSEDSPATGTTMLPTLRSLRVEEYIPILGPLLEAKDSFITSRRLSGHPIEFYKVRNEVPTPVRDKNSKSLISFCRFSHSSAYLTLRPVSSLDDDSTVECGGLIACHAFTTFTCTVLLL